MKIAFVAQPFDIVPPVHNSSIPIWIDELSHHIAPQHEVIVYSRKTHHFADRTEEEHVKHIRVSPLVDDLIKKGFKGIDLITRKIFREDRALFYRYYYFKWYYYLFYILAIALRTKIDKVDVIIVTNFSQFLPLIRVLNKEVKTVLMMQCDWLIELEEGAIRQRLSKIDLVMGCSNYIIDGIKEKFPQLRERAYTLYNGSNPAVFKNNEITEHQKQEIQARLNLKDEKIILFVGRITPEKGVHVLLKALQFLPETDLNWRLLVIGSFAANPPNPKTLNGQAPDEYEILKQRDYRSYLEDLAQSQGDRVTFIGEVKHYELPVYYSLADIFVHPSLWNEPFGMILTEAMLCEKPIVSTQVGGIPEIVVDGQTGYLTAPGDPQAMAKAISRLLRDDSGRQAMGIAGRKRVERHFTWNNTTLTLLDLISNLWNASEVQVEESNQQTV